MEQHPSLDSYWLLTAIFTVQLRTGGESRVATPEGAELFSKSANVVRSPPCIRFVRATAAPTGHNRMQPWCKASMAASSARLVVAERMRAAQYSCSTRLAGCLPRCTALIRQMEAVPMELSFKLPTENFMARLPGAALLHANAARFSK